MTSTAMPFVPTARSQAAILAFYKDCHDSTYRQYNIREALRVIDLDYMREFDWSDDTIKSKFKKFQGDPTKFQNIILPVIMPQVETAVAYQAAVFLSGYPMFSAVTKPGLEDVALQMDSVIEDQQVRGDWHNEFTQTFRDGYKYNLMGIEVDWAKKTTFAPESGTLKELIWQGNTIRRLDLYNTFFDTRVAPRKISSEGEFAGYTRLMSRILLKQYISSLPSAINVTQAFESGNSAPSYTGSAGNESYYTPVFNPDSPVMAQDNAMSKDTNWLAWAGLVADHRRPAIEYHNSYVISVIYGRIIPTDFAFHGVPGTNTPQVWKFIIVNGSVVIYAERLTNAHDLLPMIFGQPLDDGLGYQTKSFAQNLSPIQNITSAISNLSIAARRRAVADRMLYDAARISPGHINSDQPVARIPVKPSVSGQSLANAVYQLPFEDGQFQINQAELQGYFGYANMISGLNPAKQGQFVKGNKTRFEFAEIMGNANARDQLISIGIEGSLMTPTKEIIKLNIFQYQPPQTILSPSNGSEVEVDPVQLREASIAFRLSDGLTPADKMIDGETVESAFQAMAQSPQLGEGYNLTKVFSYLMKTRGADLAPFEKSEQQMAYEQALNQWSQTIAMVVQELSKNKELTMEDIQEALPPQPKPEEFGYDPSAPANKQPVSAGGTKDSILDQATAALNPPEQQQATQQPQG